MRLVETTGPQSLPHDVFRKALKDMHRLYGGTITAGNHPVTGEPHRTLTSPDELVRAVASGRRPTETLVGFNRLHFPEGAQRWAALQAYRGMRSVAFGYLHTEVPGIRAHNEWSALQNASRKETLPGNDPFFTSPVEYTTPDGSPLQYTAFHAYGKTLPEAAHTLAENYTELLSRSNDEPDLVVARALGVRSLDYLEVLWSDAMAERTPLAAGQLVLEETTREEIRHVG